MAFPFIPSAFILLLQNLMMCVGLPVDVVVVAPHVELGIRAAEEAAPSRKVGEGAVAGGIIRSNGRRATKWCAADKWCFRTQ